jgi:hypothetical protein
MQISFELPIKTTSIFARLCQTAKEKDQRLYAIWYVPTLYIRCNVLYYRNVLGAIDVSGCNFTIVPITEKKQPQA